ncbi:MAG: hypothetical protein QOF48_3492 [Verrucomicrobiota bacterium]|jgi:three-Cys-motif partner protein
MRLFDWTNWQSGTLPPLEDHSEAKLKVLRDYVEDYICILCAGSFGRDEFKITVVDGFAGGGAYAGGKAGSPLVLLEAVEKAEARINSGGRQKPLKVDCDFYFIESDPDAFACLQAQLLTSKYADRIGKTIFPVRGSFQERQKDIVAKSQQRFPQGGARVIFFLDQCGYCEVDPRILKQISSSLNNKAEFIINFAVDTFNDIVGDHKRFRSMFPSLGLESELSADDLIRAKECSPHDWRYLIESMVGPAFRNVAGSRFFSPFYIMPAGNHRGYWLLHLAPHARARSAMLDVYWRNANGHRHFGNPGLNMLAFKADADQSGYFEGMTFDDMTRRKAQLALAADFARVINDTHVDGVSFKDFSELYCNQTIANTSLIAATLEQLAIDNQILIKGAKGAPKRSEKIQANDIIRPNHQLFFPALNFKAAFPPHIAQQAKVGRPSA